MVSYASSVLQSAPAGGSRKTGARCRPSAPCPKVDEPGGLGTAAPVF